MHIKKIHIQNIGRFQELEINFWDDEKNVPNQTIFIGDNGAGKSTILEAILLGLSWFIARIKSEKTNGLIINELTINNNANFGSVSVFIEDKNSVFSWKTTRTKKGRKAANVSNLDELNKLTSIYRQEYSNNALTSYPLIVHYNAHRGVLDIPIRIRTKHIFEQLNGYDNALKGSVDYRTFFEWFREREAAENSEQLKVLKQYTSNSLFSDEFNEKLKSASDYQLNAVRIAISNFLPNISNLRVERKPRLHMAIDKDGEKLNIEQLSQGEKLMIAMVGDIARRLAILNPDTDNPLTRSGIVLIDEAELHLHPKWQRDLLKRLNDTFPNCQFIITTHSPLIVSDFQNTICYSLSDGELEKENSLFGLDVNQVLVEAMDTDPRNKDVQNLVDSFRNSISNKDLQNAKLHMNELELILPKGHIELIKSNLLLQKLEIYYAQNK